MEGDREDHRYGVDRDQLRQAEIHPTDSISGWPSRPSTQHGLDRATANSGHDGFIASQINHGRRLDTTRAAVHHQIDPSAQTVDNFLAISQRQLIARQLERRAEKGLPDGLKKQLQ